MPICTHTVFPWLSCTCVFGVELSLDFQLDYSRSHMFFYFCSIGLYAFSYAVYQSRALSWQMSCARDRALRSSVGRQWPAGISQRCDTNPAMYLPWPHGTILVRVLVCPPTYEAILDLGGTATKIMSSVHIFVKLVQHCMSQFDCVCLALEH